MIKRFLRVTLTSLAIVMAIAGSLDINRVNAGRRLCIDECGCNGGPTQCCSEGSIVCYLTQI